MKKKKSLLKLFLLLFVLGGFFYLSFGPKGENYEVGYLLGQNVPEFKLPYMNDENAIFSNQTILSSNKEFQLINFFASWCGTCEREHDLLLELAQNDAIEIYGVAWKDSSKKLKKWLEDLDDPYKKIAMDKTNLMKSKFGLIGVPESFLIYQGKIIGHFRGPINLKDINDLVGSL